MELKKLSQNEAAETGLTHKVTIGASDLTAADTSQDVTLLAESGSIVRRVMAKLTAGFVAGTSTSANSITCSVGNTDDTAVLMTATQIDANGTFVSYKAGTSTSILGSPTDPVIARFTSEADLSTITNGSIDILLGITKLPSL